MTPTYEQLLESAINTYANEMGWDHEDDVANAVENVTLVFEAIDLRSIIDKLRAYEHQPSRTDQSERTEEDTYD